MLPLPWPLAHIPSKRIGPERIKIKMNKAFDGLIYGRSFVFAAAEEVELRNEEATYLIVNGFADMPEELIHRGPWPRQSKSD